VLGDGDMHPQVRVPVAVRPLAVEVGQGSVVWAGPGDQYVVDGRGQPLEEAVQAIEIGGVERLRAQRADLARRLLKPVRVPSGEDDVGALGAGQPRGLQPDARAAADQDDCLPGQLRLAH
jgi:hypothetical protein